MRAESLDMVFRLAQRDPRILFIGSDLGQGTLDDMRQAMPQRFFMEGVSEANIIGMAAGLAMQGFIPYVNTIATFITRRCYEQIAVDLCLHHLPVRLIGNGGGLVYAPLGPTHLAIEDISLMRSLPNMTILVPSDAPQMVRLMEQTVDLPGPVYIRVAKGNEPELKGGGDTVLGKARVFIPGREIVLVASGVMLHRALQVAERLNASGEKCGVVQIHTIKPLDTAGILHETKAARLIVTLEEHVINGGLGSAVAECLADAGPGRSAVALLRLALPDAFPEDYDSQDHLLASVGLDVQSIEARIRQALAPVSSS